MIAVATFFVVLLLSLIVVRVASVALMLTGMSHESARFQARSAWTGTGFTTDESESVVGHPVRRNVISTLMVLRGAGIVTAAAALILSFVGTQSSAESTRNMAMILVALLLVWLVSRNRAVDRWMTNVIKRILGRVTDLDVRDYAGLFHIGGDYTIVEMRVDDGGWLAGRTLAELELPLEGVLVLGVQRRGGEYVGAPRGRTRLEAGDLAVLYGRGELLGRLDGRARTLEGEADRRAAMVEQARLERESDADEPAAAGADP